MTIIDGLGPAAPLRPTGRTGSAARSGGGFAVAASDPPASDASPVAEAQALQSLDALLALQEAPDPLARDRAARRRAQDLLQALAALQRALLADEDGVALGRIETLLRDMPIAADPALADLAAAVTLRARVELARRGR